MFAWSQLDFSAIPVSISAVSSTGRQTWQNVNIKRRLQRIQNAQEGKRHQKKETSSCFCLCSFCFWGVVSNSWIWILNDIGRNFLLGNRKKTAKCLMRPSTCRSTFLYGEHILLITTQTQPQRELKRSLGQVVFFKFLILRGSWLMHCVLSAHAQLHSHSNISPPHSPASLKFFAILDYFFLVLGTYSQRYCF